jgi:ABC-type transporter Mla subunit MlaD
MSVDVRKTLTDAVYIAVGVGVLGFQQVQTRRRELTEQLASNASPLHAVSAQTKDLRLKVKSNLDRATEAAQTFTTDVRDRAKPTVEQVIDRIEALPDPVSKAAEPVIKAARQLVGANA